MKPAMRAFVATAVITATAVHAQDTFFNFENLTVELGASMSPEPFANRSAADSLASIINLPDADATEFHTQSEHVWINGGHLELEFTLLAPARLDTFHFWNYHGEGYDVDRVLLTCYDASDQVVAVYDLVDPVLGNSTGSDSTPIAAQDFPIGTSAIVTRMNALLTGSNGQVDFNNMAFTGRVAETGCSPADLTTSGATLDGQEGFGVADGIVDLDDLGYFLNLWVASDPLADLTRTGSTLVGQEGFGLPDGVIDLDDLGYFLNFWVEGCP